MKTKKQPAPKPAEPTISATSTTTVRIWIKGHDITLTKDEAQKLAAELTAAVGQPSERPTPPPTVLNDTAWREFERLRKEAEKMSEPERPIFPHIPYQPYFPPATPIYPDVIWGNGPQLDYTKFPSGTLLRVSTVDEE